MQKQSNIELKKRLEKVIEEVYLKCLNGISKMPQSERVGGNTLKQGELSEAASQIMIEFLLSTQYKFGCEDKEAVLACTIIDLFCDYAEIASGLKQTLLMQGLSPDQVVRDKLELTKSYLQGLSYIMMMHMGNDVIYFSKKEKLSIYQTIKAKIYSRLKVYGGIRLCPYIRLLIEPLFAYNHFEEDDGLDDGLEIDEYDSEESDASSDEEDKQKKKKKKIVIKGDGYKIDLNVKGPQDGVGEVKLTANLIQQVIDEIKQKDTDGKKSEHHDSSFEDVEEDEGFIEQL